MLKIYCAECGSPTNYSMSKPKFCSNCGNSFEKIITASKKVVEQPTPPKKIFPKIQKNTRVEDDYDDDDDEDVDEVNYVPEVSNLDCEIIESKKQNLKIKDVIGTANPNERTQRIKGKKLNKLERKKFMEEFQKEAGALRPKSRGRKDG